MELTILSQRLRLRLPPEHAICEAVTSGRQAMAAGLEHCPSHDGTIEEEERVSATEAMDDAGTQMIGHLREFSTAVRDLVGLEQALAEPEG